MKPFPTYRQTESKDCGPTCIKIIAKHYGKTFNIEQLRGFSETTREGSSLLGLSEAVEKVGLGRTGCMKIILYSLFLLNFWILTLF